MIRNSKLDENSNRMRNIWARLRGTAALRIETATNTEFELTGLTERSKACGQ